MKKSEKIADSAAEIDQKLVDPKAFFATDRGERAYYLGAGLTEEVRLPLTRDGFEAMLEAVCGQFTPPLPVDDSTRKVFSGWVHHIENEVNTTTIEKMGKILYKSVSNALTWTIDQEIKKKGMDAAAKAQQEADEKCRVELVAQRQAKLAEKEKKYGKKGKTHVTVTPKKNETPQ